MRRARDLGCRRSIILSRTTCANISPSTRRVLLAEYDRWEKTYQDWRKKNPDKAQMLDDAIERKVPDDLFDEDSRISLTTRNSRPAKPGAKYFQPLAQAMPFLISGSADLHGSTLNYIKDGGDFTRTNPAGRNIHFGIREHGMCAIMNGVSYHGIFRASGATFLVFTDYCRASIRLAALSKLPNIYIFTHDSIGVGEDGPTHEPVETVASVRVMPQIDVIRPADPEETAGAFVAAAQRTDGPTLLALTRQAVPILNEIDVKLRREGVLRGGYIAKKETGKTRSHFALVRKRIAACAGRGERVGRGDPGGLAALFRAVRAAAGELSRRSSA